MPLCVAAIYVDICRQGAPAAAQYVDKAAICRQRAPAGICRQGALTAAQYVDKA